MVIGIYIKEDNHWKNKGFLTLLDRLKSSGVQLYNIIDNKIEAGTDVVLSVGGDGTFLSAAQCVGNSDIPILGVNLGRLGFLSEYTPEAVDEPLLKGLYSIENRDLLKVDFPCGNELTYALNEVTIHRKGAAIMGIKVVVDGMSLPTYWADGLIVATSSGSTAYSLSAGGPICMPESKVLLIVPIAPHNLNVRPLIVPNTALIQITPIIRYGDANLTIDNRTYNIENNCKISISLADFNLKRMKLINSSFVNALKSKLFWGEDIRNNE